MALTIRTAVASDDAALTAIDDLTWSPDVSPAPAPAPGRRFFAERIQLADTLVAESGGHVVGYVVLGPATPLRSNRHVLMIHGLAVAPAHQRAGVARALLRATTAEARSRGARRLRLRVLRGNKSARALYASMGFVVEGVLRGEFLLDGRYHDDLLLAIDL